MQMGQHVGVKLLTPCLIGRDEDFGNGRVNLSLILKTKLCCIVTVYRGAHCRKGRLRIVRGTPADVEHHVKVTGLHVIAVRLFLLAVDI